MLFRTLFTGILLTAGALAQTSSFPKPAYFREAFQKTQTTVELKDPVRLKDFVVGDKLELSLKNYLALVMSNNTDIQIQMLSLEMPKNAIQRAFGVWDPRAVASFNTTRATTPPIRSARSQKTNAWRRSRTARSPDDSSSSNANSRASSRRWGWAGSGCTSTDP